VYFRQGKVAEAEKYFTAARNLAPIGRIGYHLGQIYERQGKKQAAIDAYSFGLAASTPEQEVREEMYSRLLAVVGNQATVDATLKLARQDFSRQHGVKVDKLSTEAGSAEFWLLLGPSGKAEDVKFISGVESFRSFTKSIAALKFRVILPEGAPAKLLRRGVLVCMGGNYGCDFTLQDPRTVHLDSRVVHSAN